MSLTVTQHPNHVGVIRSLYRSLLRTGVALKRRNLPLIDNKQYDQDVCDDIEAAKIDSTRYRKYLHHEIMYYIHHDFRNEVRTEKELYERIQLGSNVHRTLYEFAFNNDDSMFIEVLRHINDYRLREQRSCNRISQRFHEADKVLFDGKIPKSAQNKFAFPVRKFQQLTNTEREKRIHQELKQSNNNKNELVRRYLKHLQMKNVIPIPSLLPYNHNPLPDTKIKLSSKIHNSTAMKTLRLSYNKKYIDSILLPELEFDINYNQNLDKILKRINEKGPFPVKIRQTQAGPITIPYLKLPHSDLKSMRQMALDIKKLTQLYNLILIWEENGNNASLLLTKNSDNTYPIGWFREYGRNARMISRTYYEQLTDMESYWEYLIDKAMIQGKDNQGECFTHNHVKQDLQRIRHSYQASWKEPITISSDYLNNRYQKYYKKYNKAYMKTLIERQKAQQARLNLRYNDMINRYNNLIKALETHNISKHSDIVHSLPGTSFSHNKYLIKDDDSIKKFRQGMPLTKASTKRKTLSDYMEEHGFTSFKVGMRYKGKF